jgi:hypothetical protein
LEGSYTCDCNAGYTGDGLTCVEITTTTTTIITTAESTTDEISASGSTPLPETAQTTPEPIPTVAEIPSFVIVKADTRENVTDDASKERVKSESLDKLNTCLEDYQRRNLKYKNATVRLYPDEDSDKKDLIKMAFTLIIPPVAASELDKEAADIESDLRQCFNDTDTPRISDGSITDQFVGRFNPCNDPFTNECHALADCAGSAVTGNYTCTCREGTTDGDTENPGRDCRVVAVAGSEAVRSILVVLAVAMFFVIGVLGFMAYQKATAQGS